MAIKGVVVKNLTIYPDERGNFREILRAVESDEPIAQISAGLRYHGVANGWHIHQYLSEWIFVTQGLVRLALKDCRLGDGVSGLPSPTTFIYRTEDRTPVVFYGLSESGNEYEEILIGDGAPVGVFIPHGVAHAYMVLNGPAQMIYIASKVYDPSDEGRIDFNRWPLHKWWRTQEIR